MRAPQPAFSAASLRCEHRSNRVPINRNKCPREGTNMLKTLSAALIAASVMLAPMAISANAAPAAKPVATKQAKIVKAYKRHVVRHTNKFAHKRHMKTHQRAHVAAARVRAN